MGRVWTGRGVWGAREYGTVVGDPCEPNVLGDSVGQGALTGFLPVGNGSVENGSIPVKVVVSRRSVHKPGECDDRVVGEIPANVWYVYDGCYPIFLQYRAVAYARVEKNLWCINRPRREDNLLLRRNCKQGTCGVESEQV